ncbi:MAG: Ig-like domain-containing protein [Eubacterium sp.]|nr:Ig-like domain-containing protein [Eubacterium sp.]
MNKKHLKKIIASMVACALILSSFGTEVSAATTNPIQLSQTSVALDKGSSITLSLLNIPSGAKVKWSTSNKFAASVTKKGKVTALHYGVSKVKAKYKSKYYVCSVTIADSSRSVKLNSVAVTLVEGQPFQLIATADKTVKFMSSNTDIATVDANGLIKAVNPGVAVVTAKTTSGFRNCTVTVNPLNKVVTKKEVSTKKAAIRRYTDSNQPVFDYISWAKGQTLRLIIANLDEAQVKKVVWGTKNDKILEKPVAEEGSKIVANAQTLEEGSTKATATVTMKDGTVKEFETNVRVSDPKINANQLKIYKAINSSTQWQQYISFTGLNDYSTIIWGSYDQKVLSCKDYQTKRSFTALNNGTGTVRALVDGKMFYVKYNAYVPKISGATGVLKAKTKKTIKVSGTGTSKVKFISRDKKIAKVTSKGQVKTKKAGIVYVDIQMGNVRCSRRVEVAAKGMKTIIKRANYIVNHWKYSQAKRLFEGYYDCSALVWKGYKAYNNYQKKLSSIGWPLSAGAMFDYLNEKGQIIYYGYLGIDQMKPGDLIFYGDYENAVKYSTPGRTLDIYHVSMYAGNGKVVEKGGKTITYNSINDIVGIGRVVK